MSKQQKRRVMQEENSIVADDNNHVYLVQPSDLRGTNILKLGVSINCRQLMGRYGKEKIIYHFSKVTNRAKTEKKLIEEFTKLYDVVRGKEYFRGNIDKMRMTFYEVVFGMEKIESVAESLDPIPTNISCIRKVTRLRHELDRFCIFCLGLFKNTHVLVHDHRDPRFCEKRFEINSLTTECPDCKHVFSSCHHLIRHLTYGLCLQANAVMGLRLTDVTSPIVNGLTTRDDRYFIWRNVVLGMLPISECFYLPGGKVISIERVQSLFREHAETAFFQRHNLTVNDQGVVQFKPEIYRRR